MENLQNNEAASPKSTKEKFELKEYIEPTEVKAFLQEWLSALNEDRDLEVTIKGQSCRVPKEALVLGKTKAEYEIKKGEYELELELKWRAEDLTPKQ